MWRIAGNVILVLPILIGIVFILVGIDEYNCATNYLQPTAVALRSA